MRKVFYLAIILLVSSNVSGQKKEKKSFSEFGSDLGFLIRDLKKFDHYMMSNSMMS